MDVHRLVVQAVAAKNDSKKTGQVKAVGTFSEEDVEGCRCIFQLLDVDGSGTISTTEVQKLLHMLGFAAGSQDVVRLVKQIDSDGSGEIDFQEFLTVISGLSKPSYSKWQLQHAFRLLSTEQAPAHHISRAALQHHLATLCSKDPREVERLMRPLGQGAALNYHAVTAQYL